MRLQTARPRTPAAIGLVGLLAALAFVVAGPTTAALAHVSLVATYPGDGERLDVVPDAITLAFDGDLAQGGSISVTGPDGNDHVDAAPQIDGPRAEVPLTGEVVGGAYQVEFALIAGDGHEATGGFAFTINERAVEGVPDPEKAPAPEPTEPDQDDAAPTEAPTEAGTPDGTEEDAPAATDEPTAEGTVTEDPVTEEVDDAEAADEVEDTSATEPAPIDVAATPEPTPEAATATAPPTEAATAPEPAAPAATSTPGADDAGTELAAAEGDDGGGGSTAAIVAAVLVLLVIGGGAALWSRRRGDQQPS